MKFDKKLTNPNHNPQIQTDTNHMHEQGTVSVK